MPFDLAVIHLGIAHVYYNIFQWEKKKYIVIQGCRNQSICHTTDCCRAMKKYSLMLYQSITGRDFHKILLSLENQDE